MAKIMHKSNLDEVKTKISYKTSNDVWRLVNLFRIERNLDPHKALDELIKLGFTKNEELKKVNENDKKL
jgi:hypothetical protein